MKNNWEKILLKSHNSIREALKLLNDEALRIVIVVDDKNQILGVVTDGDIRRGILNNINLDDSVTLVMNHNPVTADDSLSKSQLVKKMSENNILAIPIVQEDSKKITGLETIEQSIKIKKHLNPVFIMAGGFGTRLRPLTDNCPKPMLKIGNKPILETIIIQFSNSGFKNIFISTHYMPEQIMEYFGDGHKWGVNITYVHEDEPLGTGGALGLLPEIQSELPLIVINGDVLTTIDLEGLLAFHNDHEGCASMCVREYEYQVPYGVIRGDGKRIISMDEKPMHKFFVNAGIYVLNSDVYKKIPSGVRVDMPTVLETQINESKKVMMFPIHEYWLDIGKMDDFERAQKDYYFLGLDK